MPRKPTGDHRRHELRPARCWRPAARAPSLCRSTSPASRRRPTSPACPSLRLAIRSVSRRCCRTCSTIMRPTTSTPQAQAGGGGARRRDQVPSSRTAAGPRGRRTTSTRRSTSASSAWSGVEALLCQITYKRLKIDPAKTRTDAFLKFVPSRRRHGGRAARQGSPISRSDEPRVDERTRQCRASPVPAGWIDPCAGAQCPRSQRVPQGGRPRRG